MKDNLYGDTPAGVILMGLIKTKYPRKKNMASSFYHKVLATFREITKIKDRGISIYLCTLYYNDRKRFLLEESGMGHEISRFMSSVLKAVYLDTTFLINSKSGRMELIEEKKDDKN